MYRPPHCLFGTGVINIITSLKWFILNDMLRRSSAVKNAKEHWRKYDYKSGDG